MDAPFSFNRSIRIGSRRDRITGDSGALTGRELLRRSRVVRFLANGLPDKRDGRRIRHSQRRLARTLLLLAGQGRREHSDAAALRGRSGVAAGHRRPGGHGSAGQGRAPALAADAVAAGGGVVGEGWRRGAARGVAAAGGLAAEGDGRVAASEDAGHRHRQPAGRGSRGTAGQRVERLLSPARVSSDRGGGGGDGRHPGPAAARGAGPHGGRRAGVCAGGAGAGGAASVRQRRRALRRGISRRAADGGAGGAGHALCGPGAQQRRAEAPGAAGHGRRGLGCVEQRGARWRAPHLGLRVVLPGRVVVPFPQGRAGRRRAAGRTHPALLPAADFDALGGDVRRGPPGAVPQTRPWRRAIWGS